MAKSCLQSIGKKILQIIANTSIEPVFFLDGLAFSIMIVLVESLQFDKICNVNLGYNQTVCDNFDIFPDEKQMYDLQVGAFKRNEGIITSVIPLFFILFIGAWSDKYGRKIPLCLTLFAHIMFSGGYLINSIFSNIRVDYLYIVGFLDSIGGGPVAFLTVSNAYISDVTTLEERTTRVALANSLWFLGGPLGTFIGTQIFIHLGYTAVFSTSFILYIIAILYVGVCLPESYGPFADKERLKSIVKPTHTIVLRDTIVRMYGLNKTKKNNLGQTPSQAEKAKSLITYKKMIKDFFDVKRVIMSFKCVFRKRDGYTRLFIFLLILSNFLRKIGRGAYAFYFTRDVLKWDAKYYGYWVTYKNLVSTLGSMVAVPILSTKLNVSDSVLAMVGSLSSVIDYLLYGMVTSSTAYLMWIAPSAALLINSCSIAMRAMMSKYVNADELGQVSAVTGTIEGIVPVVSTSLYSAITTATFETFPGAQYFFGSACNIIMLLIFIIVCYFNAQTKTCDDKGPDGNGMVQSKKAHDVDVERFDVNRNKLQPLCICYQQYDNASCYLETPDITTSEVKHIQHLNTENCLQKASFLFWIMPMLRPIRVRKLPNGLREGSIQLHQPAIQPISLQCQFIERMTLIRRYIIISKREWSASLFTKELKFHLNNINGSSMMPCYA